MDSETGIETQVDEGPPLNGVRIPRASCKDFARMVFMNEYVNKDIPDFSAHRLHRIIHRNDEKYVDHCPGYNTVKVWFKQFTKEIA